ncbi:4Fe-4S dicluster domain-containing protein [Spirochaetota bacterium]
MDKIMSKDLDTQFKFDIAASAGGENIKLCFACGTCTAGCPVAGIDPEFDPRKIIRQVLLGMKKEVLSSPVIWRCVQCYSCTAKCPQNVRFREIIRALREEAVKEKFVKKEMIEEINELNQLSQKLNRKLVTTLVEGKKSINSKKKEVEKIIKD